RPVVDRVLTAAVKQWAKRPLSGSTRREILALRRDLQAGEYDAVLDLQGAVRSAGIGRMAGCRRVIGAAVPREPLAKRLYTEAIFTREPHVIGQAAELGNAIAGDLLEVEEPWLPVDPAAEAWCDRIPGIAEAREEGRPVVLLHPGGGWGAKRWPAERYGVVAAELARRGAEILVHAGPGEEEALARVALEVAHGAGRAVSCSIPELISLSRRVSLVIGGDTGPAHLASSLGKAVVGLYGPTDPVRNGPYWPRHRVLRNPESRTDHARREATEAGLLTIQPETVLDAALGLMLEEHGEAERREAERRLMAPVEEEWL
ncbi:MAG TPA: glycosyltransferase family 9 protein, partial [Acidobacteriaceae bacterium]|nr:glycosyltransferase family 9 protein [Acidobacteriaceae bacterium]